VTPGGSWSGWTSLGSPSSYDLRFLVVSRNADGTLEVFVTDNPTIGTDEVYRCNQNTAGGSWSAWTNMGGAGTRTIDDMAVGQNVQDGRLEVFVLRNDDHVVHKVATHTGGCVVEWLGGHGGSL
jgi:hypothetical protein